MKGESKMRVLRSDGEIVAINKNGRWERLANVSEETFGEAFKAGDVEYVYPEPEASWRDVLDFSSTLTICFLILFLALSLIYAGR